MKKRILSLVLCAVMLLSMCLFMGAGVTADTADTVDTTETAAAAETANIVSFTNAGPLVKPEQTVGPARVRALAANDTGSGVKLDKTVTGPDNDGNYTVRLEAYATGEQTTVVSTKPCDIVLVLDVSGSMDWCIEGGENCSGMHATTDIDTSKTYYVIYGGFYYEVLYCTETHHWNADHEPGWYYKGYTHKESNRLTPKTDSNSSGTQFYVKEACTSRLSALKTAVGNFIDQVADKETDTVKHNISIVKFASGKSSTVGNSTDGNGYNYSQIVMNLTDAEAGQKELKNAVNTLNAAGATRADYGMEHAKDILSEVTRDSTKVVVMFTDGSPTANNKFSEDVANDAISAAKSLKGSGATVYTVGCLDGADGTPVTNFNGVSDVNKYMHLVSSNYKNAESMSSPGTSTYPAGGKSYYLSAGNSTELNNVFENISSQIGGSDTELTSSSVLKDAVTPYFEIPGGADALVTLKTANCTGADNNGKLTFDTETDAPPDVKATVSGNTVSVTGFDYKTNWCGPRTDAAGSTTYSGQKLIVEFKIQPTDTFLGGNGVQTNVGKDDGIYAPGETTPVEKFQPQQVDVTVKAVEPKTTGTEIYLGEKTDLADRVITNIPQLDGTNNAYVDVTYTVKDENGTVVGTYTVPAGKTSSEGTWAWMNGSEVQPDKTTTYTVTSTSTPSTGDKTNTADVEKQFTITVKTCSLTITKTVKGEGANPNQTFVFNVMKGNDLVTTVVLKAGTSTTITGLAVGDYTVAEDTAWSWRYTAENGGEAAVTLSSTKPNGEAEITNTYVKHDWLTSIVDVINKWTAKDNIDNTGHVPGSGTN